MMQQTTKMRDSGIELLRIITMLGVITLHYNQDAFKVVEKFSSTYYFLAFTEGLFIGAVDLFILISGYYMCNSQKRKLNKPIELLVQLYVIRISWRLLIGIAAHKAIGIGELIMLFIPNNYFIVLYITVYFLSPYMNRMMHTLSTKQLKTFIMIIIIVFSIWVTFFDLVGEIMGEYIVGISTIGMYDSGEGFTIITFMMSYLVGAYIRITEADKKYNNVGALVLMYIGCSLLLSVSSIINNNIGKIMLCSALEYCNPFVVLEAALVFLIFKNIRFQSKIVNTLAQSAFVCFLLHQNLFRFAHIQAAMSKPLYVVIMHWILTVVSMYFVCWIVYMCYDIVTKRLFTKLDTYMSEKGLLMDLGDYKAVNDNKQ